MLSSEDSLSSRVFRTLADTDVESIHLIRQCHFLESAFKTNFTSEIISSKTDVATRDPKREILKLDNSLMLTEAKNNLSLRHVHAVTASPDGG